MPTALHPTFLIAATINEEGYAELPAIEGGAVLPLARLHVAPDDTGGLVQRVVSAARPAGRWEPLDTALFAKCLGLALGPATPGLFALRGIGTAAQSKAGLLYQDAASEQARRRAIRSAFLVHLAAYEERLV